MSLCFTVSTLKQSVYEMWCLHQTSTVNGTNRHYQKMHSISFLGRYVRDSVGEKLGEIGLVLHPDMYLVYVKSVRYFVYK